MRFEHGDFGFVGGEETLKLKIIVSILARLWFGFIYMVLCV